MGEDHLGLTWAGAGLLGILLVLPLTPNPVNRPGNCERDIRRDIRRTLTAGALRVTSLVACAWLLWWLCGGTWASAAPIWWESAIRGGIVTMVMLTVLAVWWAMMMERLAFTITPLPILTAYLLAAIAMAPAGAPSVAMGAVGMVAFLTGLVLGFMNTGRPQGTNHGTLLSAGVTWLMATAVGAALQSTGRFPDLLAVWLLVPVVVASLGMIYGSVLRRRIYVRDFDR
jgi:hypothetical protein